MRKIYYLVVLLTVTFSALISQQPPYQVLEGPTMLPEELLNLPLTNVSNNGRYFWGSFSREAFVYDAETKQYQLFSMAEGEGDVTIIDVLDDGTLFIQKGAVAELRSPQGTITKISSPQEEFPYVDPKAITSDKQYIVGNLSDDMINLRPYVGVRNSQGGYTIQQLPLPKEDPLGDVPTYTQAFFCSEDASTVVGRISCGSPDIWSLIVWKRGADGMYSYNIPCTDYFFNLDKPKPGAQPQWEDYVTSEDYESEEYKQQEAAYDKAYQEWEKRLAEYKKEFVLDCIWFIKDKSRNLLYCKIAKHSTTGESVDYPFVYDFIQDKITVYPQAKGCLPIVLLADGSYAVVTGDNIQEPFTIHVMDGSGTTTPMLDWIKTNTGKDISSFYEESGGSMGYPCFSRDGKTMATFVLNSGSKGSPYINSYIRFDKAITTSVEPPLVTPIEMGGPQVTIVGTMLYSDCCAQLYIYSLDGVLVAEGRVTAIEPLDLSTQLLSGSYLVEAIAGEARNMIKVTL